MKKGLCKNAADKARILFLVMTLCGTTFVDAGNVLATGPDVQGGHLIWYKDTNFPLALPTGDNLTIIGTRNNYAGENTNIFGVINKPFDQSVDGMQTDRNIFGYFNTIGQ